MDLLSLSASEGHVAVAGRAFSPGLYWSFVVSDTAIAVACVAMLLGIAFFVRKRPDAMLRSLALLFSAFLCGVVLTQLMDIWAISQSDYRPRAVAKIFTAVIGIATAVAMWRLIPLGLQLPRAQDMQAAIAELEREIGRRKSAEEHGSDIERQLALTLASIEAGLITTDVEGNVVRLNEVAERITGWTQIEAAGKSYWEVFNYLERPDYADHNAVQVALERGFNVTTAHRVTGVARDGRHTAVEVNGALTLDDDGGVRGVLVVLKDASRAASAEDAVRRLAAIVESSSDAIIGKTLEGRITSWNAGAVHLFGYTAEEAIGKSIRMLLPPDRIEEEMSILGNIVDGRVVPAFDTVRLAKGNRPVDISVTISPIRDSLGRIVGGSKIARDISERRRTLDVLSDSGARLRFALEVGQIGDWDLDLKTGHIRRSIRHDRIFGYADLQPEWRIATFLSHVHPDERADVALSYRRALLTGQDWKAQCRVVWPDGSLHWIDIQGSTRYETGNPERMLGIVSDLTDQKSAEATRLLTQKLEGENRQILEANRLKSQFLANMSHELRSPLNAIIGFSDLLYTNKPPIEAPKQHQFIGHIRTSGHHLLQLINDVLDLSKVESGKFEFFPENVDLAAVITEVTTVLFTQIQRKRLHVQVDADRAATQAFIDPARLKQTLYNYLSNAIKFTPENGHIVVRTRLERPGFFRVEVEDSGIGIAEADLPRLFVEFQQLDASYTKRHQGTGLGLALTRRMVEAQGGSVGVRSAPGKGSVFHLILPFSTKVMVDVGPVSPDGALAIGPQWLVIEDDPADQARIAGALTESGFQVDVASSVEQALTHAGRKGYDALSLDLIGGSPGGLDVLARLREKDHGSGSSVAGITIMARSGVNAAFAVADVFVKPLRAHEIVTALGRHGLMHDPAIKVMVIDDDPVALELMRVTLEDHGVPSVLFLDGRTALDQLDREGPAAIILDLLMPGLDGFAVLDELRSRSTWRDIPVFIWTTMALSDSEYDLLAMSASAILSKGGGGVDLLLERLRRWRPLAASTEESMR